MARCMLLSCFQVMPARLSHLLHDSSKIHSEPEQQALPDQMKCHNRANELPSVNCDTVQLPVTPSEAGWEPMAE